MTSLFQGGLPAGLENDPDVRDAVKALTLTAIEEATELMETAAPAIKLQLIRVVLPAAARALAAGGSEDDLVELRQAVTTMNESIVAGLTE